MDAAYLPYARVMWPELADTIPEGRAREALGDTWANALEGFLSPLADDELRLEISSLIQMMLQQPLAKDPSWFELSAQATAAQARSGVGLVHGIAHTLEGLLIAAQPENGWGHARLCSIFLWPVMRFNFHQNSVGHELFLKYGISTENVLKVAKQLYSESLYRLALPLLQTHWKSILRDPCTRMNSVLVRPPHVDFFTAQDFL